MKIIYKPYYRFVLTGKENNYARYFSCFSKSTHQFLLHAFIFILLSFTPILSFSQAIGLNNTNPDPSSILDLTATNRGVLFPRMTQAERNAITNPAPALLIYQTNNTPGYYYNAGSAASPVWVPLLSTNATTTVGTGGWSLTGNAGTLATNNFVGTTDTGSVVFKANNIQRLQIFGSTGDILIGDATSGTLKATKELVLRQDGDTYGSSILRLRNRNTENGAIYETTDATITLVDFIFKTSISQRNFRYEARATMAKTGNPSFHIGGASPDAPTLSIGDGYAAFNAGVRIGVYPVATVPVPQPTALLHLNAGTATANTAPLKFTSGTNLTTPEAGAVEFNGTNFFGTTSTPTRKTFAFKEDFANGYLSAPVTTTSTTLGNVTGMSFPIGANETWSFEFNLENGSTSATGMQYALTFPGVLRASMIATTTGLTVFTSSIITTTATVTATVNTVISTTTGWTRIAGSVTNGATAGTVQLQFKSITAGQTSSVYANSYFTARKI